MCRSCPSSRFVCDKSSLSPMTDSTDKHQLKSSSSSSALPGIHEMFSKRQHKLPSFANFMPTVTSELTSSLRQSSSAGVVNPTQRPTAQLPPMTHKSTKDQAVQHSQSVAGFPSLDDVLSYYVSQGRLFRCQHCSILFFERGMYFLHASLHGLTSPWECSICHKVCSDKNEFTLHFVNQQHNPWPLTPDLWPFTVVFQVSLIRLWRPWRLRAMLHVHVCAADAASLSCSVNHLLSNRSHAQHVVSLLPPALPSTRTVSSELVELLGFVFSFSLFLRFCAVR